ncbi:MAG: type II toxin-antitoxin system RelE/ParE family toxin [Terriglobia bacterium]
MSPAAPKYTVAFTSDAKQDVASLDGSVKKRLKQAIEGKIAIDPSGYGTPLGGDLAGYWKHEFAAHRVIYRIYPDRQLVVICAVGKRQGEHVSDVYEQLVPMVKAGKVLQQVLTVLAGLKLKT